MTFLIKRFQTSSKIRRKPWEIIIGQVPSEPIWQIIEVTHFWQFLIFKECNKKGSSYITYLLLRNISVGGGGGSSPFLTTSIWRLPLTPFIPTIDLNLWIGTKSCKFVICTSWSYLFRLAHFLRTILSVPKHFAPLTCLFFLNFNCSKAWKLTAQIFTA